MSISYKYRLMEGKANNTNIIKRWIIEYKILYDEPHVRGLYIFSIDIWKKDNINIHWLNAKSLMKSKIIKGYNTIDEILIDIPELMLL